ncbi:hypothetical protein VTK73DRAFT_6863 [Phialemonium thermophilum]|uniref:tRNA (guanine(10)-N(2))-methyltransferase n=1 Tax=Phialemonium thermophilum TaxID=223376 RepID=A0ABR3XVS7_9PEZI
MLDYLIRFAQAHETFRLPEIQSLAVLEGIDLHVLEYKTESPFCLVRLPSEDAAKRLVRRAILVQSIFEFWGSGKTLEDLHASVRGNSSHLWDKYRSSSFKFWVDSYQGTRPNDVRLDLIQSFSFLPFDGEVRMRNPDEEFTIFEEWHVDAMPLGLPDPEYYYMGRRVAYGARELPKKYDLKKRRYISTTSMDSELALISANMVLAGPGKLMYDPFAGTGSFPIACAQFGSLVFGSDIDGRSIRGQGGNHNVRSNFDQYGLSHRIGGFFTADLTNTPIRRSRLKEPGSRGGDGFRRIFDGILCDPPYGVREGLFVLGVRDPVKSPWVVEAGIQMYKSPEFIPPKKPYSFLAMLDDILQFAAETVVDNGRLSFWMPTANDDEQEIPVPTHPFLDLIAVSTQVFNKWSRKLITYRRKPDTEVDSTVVKEWQSRTHVDGTTVNELNPFRRGYFNRFEA